ncbi:MAG: response regulator [Anaerolineae bacterium]|nr:response regulator [Anaerolineae bacterium]
MSTATVLLIEDDAALSAIMNEILTFEGLVCEIIQDGQAALDWLRNHVPAAVILDIHLPHVSGIEILHYIRSDERLAHLPVIAATADVDAAGIVSTQADLVFIKPMDLEQFDEMIEFLRA